MKYRLATKKQLFISRLPANSCPIYRDPPWPSAASRPAVLLHFLLDAFQYQKNETLPRIETALGQCAALPSSLAAGRPEHPGVTQDTAVTLLLIKTGNELQLHDCFTTFWSATEHFWGTSEERPPV